MHSLTTPAAALRMCRVFGINCWVHALRQERREAGFEDGDISDTESRPLAERVGAIDGSQLLLFCEWAAEGSFEDGKLYHHRRHFRLLISS